MKTCPVCQRPYADETMMFCLADGAQLVNVSRRLDLDATWRFTPPKTELAPTVAAPQTDESKPQSTIEYRPELQAAVQPHTVTSLPRKNRSVLPWIFGMVVVLAGSGILIAFILTRTPNSQSEQSSSATQQSSPSPATETKTPETSTATLPVNANKARSTSTQTPVPGVRALISSERPRSSSGSDRPKRETSKVTPDKKKVEQPKPTGESFIPVKP